MRLGVSAALVDGVVVPGDVAVDERSSVITAVGLAGARGTGLAVPGLVDLQVNGIGAIDLRRADRAGYAEAAQLLAAGGATAVQPTFHSQSVEGHERSLGVLAEVRADPPSGCTVLPAHLEGPFLSHRWAGAHEPQHLIAPDPAVLDRLLAAGPVGMVTLAPELPGADAAITRLVEQRIVVSAGHTDATADALRIAVGSGLGHLTHCWNAHRRLTARDPGPAGAALADDRIVVGLVGDLVHVAAEVVLLTLRAAPGRVAVTTDSVAVLAGAGTQVLDGVARRADGAIAGGVARPVECLQNLVGLGVDLAVASDACGGVQRRLLGLTPVLLRPGDPADVVVLDDSLRPVRTLVGGHEVWGS